MPDTFFKQIKTFLTALKRKRITTVAGAWVYYFLLAFVPLVVLVTVAFNLFGVDLNVYIVSRLPEEFRLAGQTVTEASERIGKGVTVFFAGAIIFSSSSLLNQMSKDGDYIYGCKSIKKRGVFRRLWAILMLTVFFAVFLITAVLVAFWNTFFANVIGKGGVYSTALTITFVILFSYAVILFLSGFICPNKLRLRDGLLGGLVSLSIMVLGTIGFVLYLKFFANYNAFYGSLSTVIVFMLWAYILMLGLSVGAVVNTLVIKNVKKRKDTRST